MMNVPEHLDAQTMYALVEGRLEPGRDRAAEAHLWRCDACRALREECAATLGAARWYGEQSPTAPAGYFTSFWERWETASPTHAPKTIVRDIRSARRSAFVPAAAAAVAILAAGVWGSASRQDVEPAELASRDRALLGPASLDPASLDQVPAQDPASALPTEADMAGTGWEDDVQFLQRVTFTIGSVDPLSKGVVLASLAEEP